MRERQNRGRRNQSVRQAFERSSYCSNEVLITFRGLNSKRKAHCRANSRDERDVRHSFDESSESFMGAPEAQQRIKPATMRSMRVSRRLTSPKTMKTMDAIASQICQVMIGSLGFKTLKKVVYELLGERLIGGGLILKV